ncbi:MAG: hypothetical protein QM679_10095 [Patulibacter sp.]
MDHSEDWEGNVRAWVTAYLAEPGRMPVVGVPKASQLPVTLRVAVCGAEAEYPHGLLGVAQYAPMLARRLFDEIKRDGRVEVRCVVTESSIAGESSDVLELLPWLG